MRSDEIVKEYKHHNHRICTFKRVKAISGFVPILKLLVKGFDNIVRDVIFKAGDPDMGNAEDSFGGYFVSRVTVSDNRGRIAVLLYTMKEGKSLRRISVR